MRPERSLGYLISACLLSLAGCTCQPGPTAPASERQTRCDDDTHAFLKDNHDRYREAIARAHSWLDELHVDPIELRKQKLKGKKKLVEQLDGYYRLWQIAEDEAERSAIQRRITEVVAVTYTSTYHDMAHISDKQFKQDSTSYLRAAVLMDRLGLDTEQYREEIRRIHPRLNAHMERRGPHQRAVFGWYYRHFGLEEPFPLDEALDAGYIARRADPADFDDSDTYQITHEIFAPYEYGERLDVDPFSEGDKNWLRPTLELLTTRYIQRNNVDLVAELISCMRFLRFVDSPVYRQGLAFLLEQQNPDGSWGDLARSRRRYGANSLHAVILHTTMVTLDALSVAFHPPWNRDLFPSCES